MDRTRVLVNALPTIVTASTVNSLMRIYFVTTVRQLMMIVPMLRLMIMKLISITTFVRLHLRRK